jgi:OOP family OmpA-OmpF porin
MSVLGLASPGDFHKFYRFFEISRDLRHKPKSGMLRSVWAMHRNLGTALNKSEETKMKALKLLAVLGAVGFLAACSTDLDRIRTTEASGGTPFTQALTTEYRDLAVFEADEMFDWRDAGYFARRGLAAAGGEVVQPEDPANRDLPADSLGEITDIRGRLLAALDGGARDSKPELAARAQARFDCWLEQQEENFQYDHISACKDELLAALAELEAAPAPVAEPAPAPNVYLVLFDFDKSNINDAAQAVVMASAGTPAAISASRTASARRSESFSL